ncbi:MAG: hypothetical protein IJ026_05180 [Candidatus Methanomethylophilaceae archaeon]|nr:hypothetical protein [Candidatus Methanomethylophilaceae archaeon]
MSPVLEPMTFDDLSELYRVEMKNSSITSCRGDLFRAMAELLTRLRADYDKQMSIDPESVMCEGANQRRKKAERISKDIMHIRTQKICQMAIRGAMGADNGLEALTSEERDYYNGILELSRRQFSEIDRLRGRRNTVDTRIDEVPVRSPVPEPPVEVAPPAVEPVPEPEDGGFIPDDMPFPDEAEQFDDIPPEEMFDDEPVPEPPVEVAPPAVEPVPVTEPFAATESDELAPVVIRVLEDLPPFVGPDRDYDLRAEDLVTLPRIMAEALVNSEKATLVRPSP